MNLMGTLSSAATGNDAPTIHSPREIKERREDEQYRQLVGVCSSATDCETLHSAPWETRIEQGIIFQRKDGSIPCANGRPAGAAINKIPKMPTPFQIHFTAHWTAESGSSSHLNAVEII
jgi:hypothetical protein